MKYLILYKLNISDFILKNTTLMTFIFLLINLGCLHFLMPVQLYNNELIKILYLLIIVGLSAVGSLVLYDLKKRKLYQVMFDIVYIFGIISLILITMYICSRYHYIWGMIYIIMLNTLILAPLFLHFFVYINFDNKEKKRGAESLTISCYADLLYICNRKYHLLFSYYGRILPDWYYFPSLRIYINHDYLIIDDTIVNFEHLVDFMDLLGKDIYDFESLTKEDIKTLQIFAI